MISYDVVIIGGGPAGMAAALAADKEGATALILERDSRLGGILNQCIHSGFGLHYFGEEMTGPEYAEKFRKRVMKSDIEVVLNSVCLSLSTDRILEVLSPEKGYLKIEAGAIVLAMGCRERTAGAIALPGTRPVGIYTAGNAQKLSNIKGYLVGKTAVVLGSGDIGPIMARRMTLEGAQVKAVLELMPYSSGLKRNIVQCLNDFDIPIKYSHTVTRVVGYPRLKGICYAPVDTEGKAIISEENYIECDTLLLSVGLISENDLLYGTGIKLSHITFGAMVDENRMTSAAGIFSCGNVLHVHDLVDNVSEEAEIAGRAAADYAMNKSVCRNFDTIEVKTKGGIRYALPQRINRGEGKIKVFFRVGNIYRNCRLIVESGGKKIVSQKKLILSPGEMESVTIEKSLFSDNIILRLEY